LPGHGFPPFDLITIGAASGPRRESIVGAYTEMMGCAPHALSWAEVIAEPGKLAALLHPNAYVRFDSPDQDRASLAALYQCGGAGHASGLMAVGDIGAPTQLALGLATAVGSKAATAANAGAMVSTNAADLACAFDKLDCLGRLRSADLPVPRELIGVSGFDDLVAKMEDARMSRVFVKLRHGAAAAGMMALARNGPDWVAITTAVIGDDDRPYATRAVRRLTDAREIARIVDRLAPLDLHVEQWLPKIGMNGRTVDLRMVVIGGETLFPVMRTSRHPMTNLHIGGDRGTADALVRDIGDVAWQAVTETALKAAALFPSVQTLGIDMAVLANGRSHAVLEVNIFGDHVKDFSLRGLTVHQAQLRHIARLMANRQTQARAA
jgi:hypothetical protein